MKKRERGVTLIECLLALIVLAVGLVGILALFPVALENSKGSMELSHGAIIAESVKHALTVALKNAVYDAGTDRWEVSMAHDLKEGSNISRIDMKLPKTSEGWVRFPNPGGGGLGKAIAEVAQAFRKPQEDLAFTMYADPWIRKHVDRVHDQADASDPYSQFEFSFDVQKINTLDYLAAPPADIEKQTTLYEFRIHVFRARKQMAATGETIVVGPLQYEKELITSLKCNISVR
jgi:prepilin-type N-terminal cleavage/methylation domain-containing protein